MDDHARIHALDQSGHRARVGQIRPTRPYWSYRKPPWGLDNGPWTNGLVPEMRLATTAVAPPVGKQRNGDATDTATGKPNVTQCLSTRFIEVPYLDRIEPSCGRGNKPVRSSIKGCHPPFWDFLPWSATRAKRILELGAGRPTPCWPEGGGRG